MHCGTCGSELIPDARFCTRCGARVELGTLLGVGTDLPQVPAQPPTLREPQPPSRHVAPTDQNHGPGGNFTPGRIAAMVATFVVLTILGTFVLSQVFGSDVADAPNSAASSASTGAGPDTASPSGESSPEPSPSEPSPSERSPSEASASPTPTTALPTGARRCSKDGTDPVATAYSGNKDTSCAFSNAVRTSYREAGAATDNRPFRTYSTVTKRWYDVTCDTASPVRCQSADGAAVVFLAP